MDASFLLTTVKRASYLYGKRKGSEGKGKRGKEVAGKEKWGPQIY